tara:strand:- start:1913 stop:2971 length:1059 start_codon:yes stop_codon:yes gene_type:complete
MSYLQLIHTSLKYQKTAPFALSNFSLSIEKNKIIVIVGESGCGKSTLLNCIAGFEKPDQGEIYLNNKPLVSNTTFIPPEKRDIGIIFQDYALFPHLSIKQNILFGIKKLNRFTQYRRLLRLTKLFKLKGLLHKYPHQLSGGEQQRISLIRSLITEPKVLLMDEPFSNIDERLRNEFREELRNILKELQITTLIVTHDIQDALKLADDIAIIKKGVLQQIDSPYKIYNQPINKHVATFFGNIFFFQAININDYFFSPVGDFPTELFTQKEKNIIDLAIRPENILISYEKKTNYIQTKVSSVSFLGDHNQVILSVHYGESNTLIPLKINSSRELKNNDIIYIKLDPIRIIEFNK